MRETREMKEVASATSSVSYADTFPIGEGFW